MNRLPSLPLQSLRSAIAGPSRPNIRLHGRFAAPRSLASLSTSSNVSRTGHAFQFACASAGQSNYARHVRYQSSTAGDKDVDQSRAPAATSTPLPTAEQPEADDDALRIEAPPAGFKSQPIAQLEPRLSLTFTCTANDCGHRSTHEFSKRSYTKGIVLVQCPECKNRHLIADHIGWFKESTEDGKLRTVEDLLRAKGETVRTGRVNFDGDIEYDPES